jgi:hypothetical protein
MAKRAGKLGSRRARLERIAEGRGLHVAAYSPGDGTTRYRFFKSKRPVSYFEGDGVYTALGILEAEAWLAGYGARR